MSRDLTEGERRVFKAYVEAETHEMAAKQLDISVQTLKNHLGSIYKKVGARKAHSAIYKLALERGVDPLRPLNGAEASVRDQIAQFEPTNLDNERMLHSIDSQSHSDEGIVEDRPE